MKTRIEWVKIGAVNKDCERSSRERGHLKTGGVGVGHGQVHTLHAEEPDHSHTSHSVPIAAGTHCQGNTQQSVPGLAKQRRRALKIVDLLLGAP